MRHVFVIGIVINLLNVSLIALHDTVQVGVDEAALLCLIGLVAALIAFASTLGAEVDRLRLSGNELATTVGAALTFGASHLFVTGFALYRVYSGEQLTNPLWVLGMFILGYVALGQVVMPAVRRQSSLDESARGETTEQCSPARQFAGF